MTCWGGQICAVGAFPERCHLHDRVCHITILPCAHKEEWYNSTMKKGPIAAANEGRAMRINQAWTFAKLPSFVWPPHQHVGVATEGSSGG